MLILQSIGQSKKDSAVITIVLTAQFEEAGQEFECALHEMLVSRGMIVNYKKTDGDVVTIVAKKLSTGAQTPPDATADIENQVSMVAAAAPNEISASDESCNQECDTTAPAQVQYAKVLSISSLSGIPCVEGGALDNSCLYVKNVSTEPDTVTFSYANFVYRYPKARPSAPIQQAVCNPNHAIGPNTICCAVILPGSFEAVNMLLTLVQCPSEEDEECLHLGNDVSTYLGSVVGA